MKKVCLYVMVVAVALSCLTGCISYNTNWEPSWTDKYDHEKRHLRAFWQDMASIHQFIDRHLFGFDESDPTRY